VVQRVALPLALRHRWLTFWFSLLLVVNAISLLGGVQAMLAMAVADLVIGALTVLWIPVGKGLRGAGLFGIRITGSNPAASITGALAAALPRRAWQYWGCFI